MDIPGLVPYQLLRQQQSWVVVEAAAVAVVSVVVVAVGAEASVADEA